nr:unnamed protein product [Callosobruchus chinensis]
MREFEQITKKKLDNDTTENKYKYVYYDEKMQVIYTCRYTQSMANLVIKSKEFRKIILNDFHLLPTSGHAEPLQITPTASSAFQKIFLDIVGPLPTHSENFKYILTKQCELTKYVEAYPLLHKDSETVAKAFVQNFILRYGIPQNIATDKGSEFLLHSFKYICKLLNITQLNSTAYQ